MTKRKAYFVLHAAVRGVRVPKDFRRLVEHVKLQHTTLYAARRAASAISVNPACKHVLIYRKQLETRYEAGVRRG